MINSMMNVTMALDNQRRKSIVTTLLATVVAASLLFIMASENTTEPSPSFILRNRNRNNVNIAVAHDPSNHDPRQLAATLSKDPKSARRKTEMDPVHLMYASDEDALEGVEASIRSVLAHASEPVVIHFVGPAPLQSFPDIDFIPLSSISEDRLSRFENESMKDSKRINKLGNLNTKANFVRFIMAELLPDVSKVLWLDADTIVRCDVVGMLRKALTTTKHVIAAVPREGKPNGLSRTFNTAIKTSFNAGVFVADLDRWRDQDITNQIASWAQRNQEEHIYSLGSQPPMALTIGENFERLPRFWNVEGFGWRKKVNANHLRKSCVLHWTGGRKHWKKGGLHKDLVKQLK